MYSINFCRVCLAESDSKNDSEILKDEELKSKFEAVSGIQLLPDDPDLICAQCRVKLGSAYAFRQNMLSAHKYLTSFIAKSRSIFEDMRKSIKFVEAYEEYEFLDNDNGEQTHVPNPAPAQILQDSVPSVEEETKVVETALEVIDKFDSTETEFELADIAEEGNQETEISEQYFDEFYERDVPTTNPEDELVEDFVTEEVEEVVENLEEHVDPFGEETLSTFAPQSNLSNYEGGSLQCDECFKVFKTKMSLKIHKRLHTGEKNFSCEYCNKCFATKGILKQHVYIHTGERPFPCKECGRSFTQGKSLVAHMRRHTGEKPFSCSECVLSFRTRDALKVHYSVKHSESKTKFYCMYCEKGLSTKHSLQFHIQHVHKKGLDVSD